MRQSSRLVSSLRYRVLERALRQSGSFDPEFYRTAHPDVATAGFDPLDHYIRFGRREGRHSSPSQAPGRSLGLSAKEICKASTDWETYDAIRVASRDPDFMPLYRDIEASGLFDPDFYRRHAPALRLPGDPLLDYQLWGWREYWDPSPDFNTLFYLASNPEARVPGMSPLSHYIKTGKLAGYPTAPATPSFEWVNNRFDPDERNPSDDVHMEMRKGIAFLTRFAFDWAKDFSDRYTDLAVAELAGRKPMLRLGNTTSDVSIVIPVYGQIHYLLNCLDLLLATRQQIFRRDFGDGRRLPRIMEHGPHRRYPVDPSFAGARQSWLRQELQLWRIACARAPHRSL